MATAWRRLLAWWAQPWVWDVAYVVLYYVLCVLVFGATEKWPTVTTIYYVSITVCTVGYGDYFPTTRAGQSAASVLVPVGIVLVFGSISDYMTDIQESVRGVTERILERLGLAMVDVRKLPIEEYSPEMVAAKVYYPRRYFVAMSPLCVLFVFFYGFAKMELELDWIEAWYLTVVTATTVGYGDYNFGALNAFAKLRYSFFVLLFVVFFANCISEVLLIRTRQRLRNNRIATPKANDLVRLLLCKTELAEDDEADDLGITEAEFIIESLLKGGLVDEQLLIGIRRRYHWTARADGEAGDIKLWDLYIAFVRDRREEIDRKEQGWDRQLARSLSGPKILPDDCDKILDREDWIRTVWTPQVDEAKRRGAERRAQRRSRTMPKTKDHDAAAAFHPTPPTDPAADATPAIETDTATQKEAVAPEPSPPRRLPSPRG